MKKRHLLCLPFFLLFVASLLAQQNNVGINTTTPHASAALQVDSKNNNQGILIPRLTTAQRTAISTPATGLMVYDTTTKSFWYQDGTQWVNIGIGSKISDADIDSGIEAIDGTGSPDTIVFTVDNSVQWLMKKDRLEQGNSAENIFIGSETGLNNTVDINGDGSDNTFLGARVGKANTTGKKNTFLGWVAGINNTTGNHNTFIGEGAGYGNTTGGINICVGPNTGHSLGNGGGNIFIGNATGHDNTSNYNVMIGHEVGGQNVSGTKNVFIGSYVAQNEMGSEKLYIDNTSTSTPLIYGEFDNDLLRINGSLNINNAFTFPILDGTSNQILSTDGSGSLSWVNRTSTKIEDADTDTSIEAIDGPGSTDRIEFQVDGTTSFEMRKDRLEESNANDNIFIGKNTGDSNTSGTNNVFVGTNAGTSNTMGAASVFIGKDAGASNSSGAGNTYVGEQTGSQATGSNNTFLGHLAGGGAASDGVGNVFLGHKAGQFEMGSNKLFIENSDIPNPLIYGEFDTDLLRINGTLNINSAFSFPTVDGMVNQVLATDGGGSVSWVDMSAGSVSKIEDTDTDTYVEAIDAPGSADIIRFTVDNFIQWQMKKDRLEEGNSNENVFIGLNSGMNNTPGNYFTGYFNTFIGSGSGKENISGSYNTFLGNDSGKKNDSGVHNLFVGVSAGRENNDGDNNVFLGNEAGRFNQSGNKNVAIGYDAGSGFSSGNNNIFIGNEAGKYLTGAVANKLVIESSFSSSPLIYGEFDNDLLRINGTLNINSAFSFPTTDGAINQTLVTDGLGNLSWANASKLEDADIDTSVEAVDGVGNSDVIEFKVNSSLQWAMKESRLEEANNDANVFIGKSAGQFATASGTHNTLLGSSAGMNITDGASNTFLGAEAGITNDLGERNTFVGAKAGETNGSGADNTFIGHATGKNNLGGNENVIMGNSAGETIDGNQNVIIGHGAANQLPVGDGNIFIGHNVGALLNAPQSNTLIIENSDNDFTPLIWGDFANDRLGVNRQAVTNALEVEGEASKTVAGSWAGNSDARLKKNIEQMDSEAILQKLLLLKGVNYEWNDDKTGAQRPEGTQYGFIAQNIQQVFPELVKEDNLGYLQTAYGTYDAMQIEAIRALFDRIEKLETENEILKAQWNELANLKAEIEEMKSTARK